MKFQPDTLAGVNAITRLERARVWVGAAAHEGSVLVPWSGAVQRWAPGDFGALQPDSFEPVLALAPEVVIFGSGATLRFPPAALLRPLIERRVGIETMDSAAACRTFNVLATEGRRVVAALLLPA
jgi:uncharacterized protein